MKTRCYFFVLACSLLLSAIAQGQTITTAVPFLRITPDSRAAGMGEGSIALADDANAMYWNNSKLAFCEHRFGLSASYVPWLRALVPDINYYQFAAYYKPDSVSAIGFSGRYFSQGDVVYVGPGGIIGQTRPREYALDLAYARKLSAHFSAGLTLRYINSDLTNGITINGKDTHEGKSFSADMGITWMSRNFVTDNRSIQFITGAALTDAGSKISYDDSIKNFIPINLGIAQGATFELGGVHCISAQLQFDKLLVPSPPIYEIDSATGAPKIVNGQYVILKGKDPDRSVIDGMLGSFSDAPDGFSEELHEITWNAGVEYAYKHALKVRCGYFHEHKTKGNRQFLTLGAGVAFHNVNLDFAYLIPTNGQRSPEQNTVRFSLLFAFDSMHIAARGH